MQSAVFVSHVLSHRSFDYREYFKDPSDREYKYHSRAGDCPFHFATGNRNTACTLQVVKQKKGMARDVQKTLKVQ